MPTFTAIQYILYTVSSSLSALALGSGDSGSGDSGSEWGIYSRDVHVCVCAYVRTYVLVTLRNVNLRSRSECQFALTLRNSGVTDMCITQGSQWRMELGGQRFLAMEDEQSRTAQLSLCNVRIWRSQVQKQVLNTETKKRTRKSSKTRIGEPSQARYCCWAPTKPAANNFWHLLRMLHPHAQCT